MSHNAEVNLCNLYQFAEAFNGIETLKLVKYFVILPIFYLPSFYN